MEDLATQLVGEALDSVYSSLEPGGIELHMPLEPMPDDEYTPPAWDESTFAQDRPDGFESRLKQVVESVTPGRPSVLDVHERERYLLSDESLRLDDIERAVDVLVELDSNIDQRMSSSSSAVKSSTSELNSLEEQMVELAQRATTADIEELIVIADELRSLEERLVELDPDREPLPPFEEDTVPTPAIAVPLVGAVQTAHHRCQEPMNRWTNSNPMANGTSTERTYKQKICWRRPSRKSNSSTLPVCGQNKSSRVKKSEGPLVDERCPLCMPGKLRSLLR